MNGLTAGLTVRFVLAVSLLVAAFITILMVYYFGNVQFQLLDVFCGEIIKAYPESKQSVLEILKSKNFTTIVNIEESTLSSFGYRPSDFWNANGQVGQMIMLFIVAFFSCVAIFIFTFLYWHKKSVVRIDGLTNYLEKVNTGSQGLLVAAGEDEFSRLQDEIYKTMTTLYQTKDAALEEKRNYADNLSNIAHQLKTPITAISLSVQMMKENTASDYSEQISRQLSRLTHLEEALLLLSRIDAGTLVMKKTAVDVFTLLTLASDNLQELFIQKGVSIDIPEEDGININADLDWTMEAIMNLMKNCMEHTKAGTSVHCFYEKNPLYVQIRIWDEGCGFAEDELPHLFERFYRGKNSVANGIGIGLSISKAIIEMQNGIIRAFNLHDGGACFEIRFYCH
ncbi:MAG: HAMP domain-containing histidine kinase [Clostridiales bacterium]|nr:HAMP domain-containing histidine kinase [Clostridiales bacterium]